MEVIRMKLGEPIKIEIDSRLYDFSKQYAVRDVYDALVELITNSDDSYHRLYKKHLRNEDGGPILVEICEQRKKNPSFIIIYDRAEGMTMENMLKKLGKVGSRHSEAGDRGFMGRGAKDCTAIGKMIVESIKDEKYYKCELIQSNIIPLRNRDSVHEKIRKRLKIIHGNGTVINLETSHRIPHIESIIRELPWHYALRDILSENSPTKLLIKNLNKPKVRPEPVVYRQPEGELVCEENFVVPGYPDAKAKLKIWKAGEPFEDTNPNDHFRRSGLVIKGDRAIHDCNLLHPGLEKELYAKRYFGRLECDFIDRLLDEYDSRRKNNEVHQPENPSLLVDPHRQTGLRKDHPFTDALFKIPSEKLRKLIEKDKEKDRGEQKEIASRETQKKLNALAKAASEFLAKQVEDIKEISIDDRVDKESISKKGVFLFPNYLNIAIGQIRSLTFYVDRSIFGNEGQEIEVITDNSAISILDTPFKLRAHPKRDDMLIGTFRIRGENLKKTVRIQTQCDRVPHAEATVKVVDNKIEEHEFITSLEFEHKLYHVREGSSKMLRLFAKYPELVTEDTIISVISSDSISVPIRGSCQIVPVEGSNYAVGEITIQGRRLKEKAVKVTASINSYKATTKVKVRQKDDSGVPLQIKIVSRNLGVYRAMWSTQNPNLLEISATHDSIKRYLGPEPNYEGQEKAYFRVLLAEIVAESVCRKALGLEVKNRPSDFKEDFTGNPEVVVDTILTRLQQRIREFVTVAHRCMLGSSEIK